MKFERCENVLVRDVTLQNSPFWTSHYLGCKNVLIDNVTVMGDFRYPNNDGIDPASTINMTIRNSFISVGDDALCPKSNKGYGPLQNLHIHDCTVRSRSSGFKIGSSTFEDMENILVEDIFIWHR